MEIENGVLSRRRSGEADRETIKNMGEHLSRLTDALRIVREINSTINMCSIRSTGWAGIAALDMSKQLLQIATRHIAHDIDDGNTDARTKAAQTFLVLMQEYVSGMIQRDETIMLTCLCGFVEMTLQNAATFDLPLGEAFTALLQYGIETKRLEQSKLTLRVNDDRRKKYAKKTQEATLPIDTDKPSEKNPLRLAPDLCKMISDYRVKNDRRSMVQVGESGEDNV